MTRLKIAAASVLLASLACAARAQEFLPDPADQDHRPHQEIERREIFLSPAGEPFRAPPGAPYPVTTWFAQVDANHDGQISPEEFRADFDRFFQVLDENHDGVVDGFEAEDYEHDVAPEVLSVLERPQAPSRGDEASGGGPGGGMGGGRGHHGGGGAEGGPGGRESAAQTKANAATVRLQITGAGAYSLLSITEPIGAADADLDGKVTLKEFRAAADRRFDLLDAKHLGYLTLESLPKTPAQTLEIKQAKERAKEKAAHPEAPAPSPPS
jgi:hypothetical protein